MFCPNCGAQIADGAAFCPNCGAPFGAQPKPRKKRSVVKIVLLALAVCIVGSVVSEAVKSSKNSSGTPAAGNNAVRPASESNGPTPKWVTGATSSVPDPGPLYNYLTEGEKALYDEIDSFLRNDGSYDGLLSYEGSWEGCSIDKAFFAYENDNPYASELVDYLRSDGLRRRADGRYEYQLYALRDYPAAYREMRAVVERVAAGLRGTSSEKVRQINAYLTENIDFNDFNDEHRSTYSALIEGQAVCKSYSTAFKAICSEVGIPCYIITGDALKRDGTYVGKHAWCIAQLEDGNWYEIDVLWNDDGQNRYFCLPTSEMSANHTRKDDELFGMCGFAEIVPVTQEN